MAVSKCDRKKINGVPVTDFYQRCYPQGDVDDSFMTVKDPSNKFEIKIPSVWEVNQNFSDTVYGIFAANFLKGELETNQWMSIAITGYSSEKPLEEYYKDELKLIKKDKTLQIRETGRSKIDGKKSFWLMFDKNDDGYLNSNIVSYLKINETNEVYIIQTTTYDTIDQLDKLCQLKFLVNTIKIQ
jgi:hypothetical protein